MKNIFIGVAITFLFLSLSLITYSAEYVVQSGNTISQIARKTNNTIAQLAQLNNIAPPNYVVRVGQKILYLSADDVRDAKAWITAYLGAFSPKELEYTSFKKMLHEIEIKKINFGAQSQGARATDIILLAVTYRRQL